MKNATEYGNKVSAALPGLTKKFAPEPHPEGLAPLQAFVLAVLRCNTPLAAAAAALEVIDREFVDYNELRVAPLRDIVELLDPAVSDRRGKAIQITEGLNKIFDHGNRLDFEHSSELGKRELRAHLRESLGFSSFVEAYMMLNVFDARAIPVDDRLVERLKADDLVHAESDAEDVRSMLERVIPAKDAVAAFAALSAYAHEESKTKARAEKAPAAKSRSSAAKRKTGGAKTSRSSSGGKAAAKAAAEPAAKPKKSASKSASTDAAKAKAKPKAKTAKRAKSTGKTAAKSAGKSAGKSTRKR